MFSNDNCAFRSSSSAPCNKTGFLQKNNSLDEKGRIVGAFSQKQQLVSELGEREQRFRRTETDFSNLFARGKEIALSQPCSSSWRWWTSSPTTSARLSTDLPKCWTSITPTSCWRAWRALIWSFLTSPNGDQMVFLHRSSIKSIHFSGFSLNSLSLFFSILSFSIRFTYEIAPVFVLMEQLTLKKMREIIGWPNGEGDGLFSPGGAISNMYSVMIARYKYFPEVKTKGMSAAPRLVLFTSEHSHYSITKAGAALGFGKENVILLSTDERGRVIPADLEAKIIDAKQKGYVPLFVNATAGTTVYGAFDPINDIADICEKYNLWLHVDGAWGGGLLMSRRHRHKLSGVERANSVTWNPHKMMGVPLQCSAILVREKGILQGCNSMCAGYLFQPDKQYDVTYDTGDKAIQCGRHVDIFKFWLMWKAKGTVGFEQHIDRCLELSEYLYNKIKNRPGYEMVFQGEPQHTNVCFWYIPPSMRNMPDGEERRERLHKVAPKIKAMMMESGTTMVGYQPQGDKVNFFRMVISNHAATRSDIDFLIDEIERLGHDL
uniref:Glutamate decarboxylase 1 n=1 Tax=Pygocentrus nattereri TaxID=42514 RepID=A0AAR2K8C6_PYGNA